VAQALPPVTQNKHQKKPKGEVAKQRASEQPVYIHLRPTMACMKIWRFLEMDTAIKWRELLVVE
jgi:hypothetical protein